MLGIRLAWRDALASVLDKESTLRKVPVCPLKCTKADTTCCYPHTALEGRNLTTATMVIKIKMANRAACVIAKGGSV
jgi:hypothetical protein